MLKCFISSSVNQPRHATFGRQDEFLNPLWPNKYAPWIRPYHQLKEATQRWPTMGQRCTRSPALFKSSPPHTHTHPSLTSFQNQLIKKHGPVPPGVKDKFEEFNPATQIRAVERAREREIEDRQDGPGSGRPPMNFKEATWFIRPRPTRNFVFLLPTIHLSECFST